MSAVLGPDPHPPLPPTRFDTRDTPLGPFLSRVLGLEAQQQKQSYWQPLTAPSTSLQMGACQVGVPGGRWSS